MVYLIHFEEPYKHARHYIGFTESNLEQRIDSHRKGTGSNLMKVVTNAGINWEVVRVWEDGDRNFERRLKNASHSSRHCPICLKNKNK